MRRIWRQALRGEGGQVLPAVLISLALGSVLIVPAVAYASNSLRSTLTQQESVRGIYAAEAGIEDVVWSLKTGGQLRTALPISPNTMQVTMSTQNLGDYTMVAGEWQPPSSHSTWLTVSGNTTWDAGANAYQYTITATYSGPGQCKLTGVGVKLPAGYDYQAGSAFLFGGNLSTGEPGNQLADDGTHVLAWTFSTITIDPTGTQIFHITGQGALTNDYPWAIAERQDIGTVGELSGTFYIVTATATRPADGKITARIVADVMMSSGNPYITSWRIYPQ